MNIIKDVTELNKAIDAWGKRGQKWAKDGHELAMSALSRLAEHGDIGPVNRLYLAMPKGTKSSAMGEWILAFGRVNANDGENAKTSPFVYAKEKQTDMVAAAKKPWFEFKPEPELIECFDVQAAVLAAIKSIQSKAAKATTSTNMEVLAKLEALVGEIVPAEAEDEAGQADPLAS
jgi:hypothetical protein